MKVYGILLFFLSGCLIQVKGQETLRFHPDPVQFIQEARDFFGIQQPESSRALLSKYEEAQKNGQLEENHWIDLARKANRLEKTGARPIPDFYLFLDAFLEVATLSKDHTGYLSWSAYVDKLLFQDKASLNHINSILDFTLGYTRKGILFKSSALQWRTQAGETRFGMDSSFFVTMGQSDLVAAGSGDSTVIFDTRGKFYPGKNLFYGEGGRITWERLRIPATQVQVLLNRYKLDLSRSVYEIDSVNLIDKRYFSDPILGRVENKILPGVSPENAGYPKFTSYEYRNRIKNLYPGMDYEGGFSLQGIKVLGLGAGTSKGVLTIYHNQKPLIRLASSYFTFQADQARGINTEASIYLETDSIYHPGLLFQYSGKLKDVSLIRDGQGISPSRYLNTYHDFDLNVDWVHWTIGENTMDLTGLPGSTDNRISFESADFFNIDRFNEILVADTKHPVAVVKQCADYYYSRTFTLEDLAKFMQKPQDLVEEMLLRLSYLGFVRYSSETKVVEVQERAFDFLKKNAGLQDYDVIRFESVQPARTVNAKLNLRDNHILVTGVKSVELSQTRNVTIYPSNQTIEILKGRNILFDGEIQGGLIRFYGTHFQFNYEDFTIRLGKVDHLNMKVYEKPADKDKEPSLADVTSIIENTRGTLRIDKPTNKSGVKAEDLPEYPVLQTDTNAYVYYDQKEILNGVYPRSTFNFNITPFTLRGLNLLSFGDSLKFPGTFYTSDIFPPMELALKHQKDHSLGFQTLKTPEEGYPVYLGKGRFFKNISMSRAGLKGSGRLEYLNSILVSDDFLFLPDQVNTVANLFAVNRDSTGNGNPETKGEQMAVKWYPNANKLVAKATKGPLNMYGTGRFEGELSLEPGVLSGKGTISFPGYSLTSNDIRLYENSLETPDGLLKIFRDSSAQKAEPGMADKSGNLLTANHYKGLIDVGRQKARFEKTGPESQMAFTQNRFAGNPSSFDWNIASGQLSLDDLRLRMAVKPSDSLSFQSSQADFVLKDLVIKAHGVDYVDVADVRIYPADRNILIRPEAKIDSLTQATLVSRDSTLVHRITNATVKLIDHKNYMAKGYYQYKDIAGREFPIFFSEIQPGRDGISTGKGTVTQESKFNLSPAFKYFGSVEWNNNEKHLLFDGQTQLSYTCPDITLQWIRFNSRIVPDSVAIPIDSVTTNDQGEKLFKGFFLSNQPVELYSTFVGPHTRYSDQPLISTYGKLWYEEQSGKYMLASDAKKADPEADGPILTLDAKTCNTEARGPLTMGVDLGQVKLSGAGKLVHDLKRDTIEGSVILAVDFFFDPKILELMAKAINNANGLEPVNYGDPDFRNSFKSLVGRTTGEELLKQLSLTGKWKKIPDELMHTMVFTNLNFSWNPETGSYQSTGKIGIGNIMDQAINKKINGYFEVVHRRGGDILSMYLEIDRQNYFFLTYTRGVMQGVAGPGQEKFNTLIKGAKEAKRSLKTEPGETGYQYYIGTYQQVQAFLRRFKVER